MTRTTDFQPIVSDSPGFIKRLIAFVCTLYLIAMVVYFVLRLIFGDSLWWIALVNAFAIYTFSPLLVLIPLALLAGLWRLVARMALLALLAVIWFGPFFQPKSIPPPSGLTLRVVTFNLWGENNPRLDAVESWLRDSNADVILLQEVPSIYAETGIEALTDIYPEQTTERQLTLSRYPIIEVEEVAGQKRVVIDVNGQSIAVYNVHLAMPVHEQSRLNIDANSNLLNLLLKYDETERNAQIEQLLAALDAETLPHIVAGDFNMSQHSITYSSLAVEMSDSFRRTSTGLGATWPVNVTPLLRLDYIWHSYDLRAIRTEVGPALGSDHLPVIADLEIVVPPQVNLVD